MTDNSDIELNVKLQNIKTIKTALDSLHMEYFSLPSDMDIAESTDSITAMEENLEAIEVRLLKLLSKIKSNSDRRNDDSEGNASENIRLNLKLPEIPLPVFTGKYDEYSNFIEQFNSLIGNNDFLSEIQKLYYLKSSLRGEAKSIESSQDTYKSLLKALELRYSNKRALVDLHIYNIINQEKWTYESPKELRALLDNIKRNIRSLEALEFERNKFSDILLLNMFLKKLDKLTHKEYEITLQSKEVPSFDEFLNFLEKRALILENVNKNVGAFKKVTNFKHDNKAKTFLVESKQGNIKPCPFCESSSHPLFRCFNFKNLSLEERKAFIAEASICKMCLCNPNARRCGAIENSGWSSAVAETPLPMVFG